MALAEGKVATIYVTLDALLDTRLGTVARIDNSAATQLLENNYHEREDDKFSGIDLELYNKLYAERDKETLAKSTITNAVGMLNVLVDQLAEQAIVRPYHDSVKVVVNTFPYSLTKEEVDEIGLAIKAWTNGSAAIELAFIQPKDLTPAFCKAAYSLMIMYDYMDWMEMHTEAFNAVRLPEVSLFAPAIYFHKTPTKEELERTIREAMHPHKALEMSASPLIDLRLIPVKYFSIVSKD